MDPILHPTEDISTFPYSAFTNPAEGLQLGKTHTVQQITFSQ